MMVKRKPRKKLIYQTIGLHADTWAQIGKLVLPGVDSYSGKIRYLIMAGMNKLEGVQHGKRDRTN